MITVNTRKDFLKELSKLLPDNSVGVELGVLNGDFSKHILDIIKPKHLILIDPYETAGDKYESGLTTAYSTETDYENVLNRFKNEIIEGQVQLIRKYSYQVAPRYFAKVDFVYNDASHLLLDLKKDLNDWLPKLKPDGIMCLHDYADIADFGVIQAVDEFLIEHNFEKVIFNTDGGDIALKRKNND